MVAVVAFGIHVTYGALSLAQITHHHFQKVKVNSCETLCTYACVGDAALLCIHGSE